MTGSITRHGKHSWRLKFEAGRNSATGERQTRYVTIRGTKKDAQAELTRQLAAIDSGTFMEPTKVNLENYLRLWIDTAETLTISGKTAERYRQLIEKQIIPHLGSKPLQKLRAVHISAWHTTLLKECAHDGIPLAARTVGHAQRVLRKALSDAVKHELISRNPASIVAPPTIAHEEMTILTGDQVKDVITCVRDSVIFLHVVLLLATGMRRGELMGLQWRDLDLDAGKLQIERAIEKTKAHGLRVKAPKTRHGRRRITLPEGAVSVLRQYRKEQLELRVALGMGRLPDEAYVFGTPDGEARDPGYLTLAWKRLVAAGRVPKVTLQALRHSHASALIARGTDAVTVSRRLGHGSPAITMSVYAHLFDKSDEQAAAIIDALLDTTEK